MFKLVVLSVLLAVAMAAPKPGLLAAAPIAYAAAPALAVPTAVSHSSRVDIHSKPVITTYAAAAPVVAAPALAYSAHVAAPWAYSAPLAYSSHVAAPLAYSAHVW